jgi:hypothetical protein
MPIPSPAARRAVLSLELLEQRLVLDGGRQTGTIGEDVNLDGGLDVFGDQIVTVQAYEDASRSAFSIFDTGSSAITFSAGDQAAFKARGNPIPIKVPGGAVAVGVGGKVVGDVSKPGTIRVGGLSAASLSFDGLGMPQFDIHFDSGSVAVPGIQAFVGTPTGSPQMPTITGTPILNPSPDQPRGLAALVNMHGARLDFSGTIPDTVLALPDLSFVSPGTQLAATPSTGKPVRVPLTLVGSDNHASPGGAITESPNPVQNNVGLVAGPTRLQYQRFLFDTGAQITIISTYTAKALGLDLSSPDRTLDVEGVGGIQKVPGFTLDKLTLPRSDGGSLEFKGVPVFVLDVGQGLDGILGMNLFNSASAMLYDPFGAGGPSVSFTFYTGSDRGGGDGSSPGVVAKLRQLGVSFTSTIHGPNLPAFESTTGRISGRVFTDYNANGIPDPGKPGLAGQTVYLERDGKPLPQGRLSTTTDANGIFHFVDLPPGTYTVREIVPPNQVQVSPPNGFAHVVATNDTEQGGVYFGNVPLQSDPITAYVATLYGTLLDRAPDAAGLNIWFQALFHGTSREQVARAIWESPEHRGRQIDEYYQTFLHRQASSAERATWILAFQSGLSEIDVERAFLTSGEYQAVHSDDFAFIAALYTDVLNRPADALGQSAWVTLLRNGVSRSDAAKNFLLSDESVTRVLDRYYADFLHRGLDQVGRTGWLAFFHQNDNSLDVIGEKILGSDEAFAWAKRLSRS